MLIDNASFEQVKHVLPLSVYQHFPKLYFSHISIFVETDEMEIMFFFPTCACSDDIAVQALAVHPYLSDTHERCVSNIWESCLM